MTGSYRVGMRAPGEIIVWTLTAPLGVDLSAAALIELDVRASLNGGPSYTIAGWEIDDVLAGSLKATLFPTGSEFVASGSVKFNITLRLDGDAYRYEPVNEPVKAW